MLPPYSSHGKQQQLSRAFPNAPAKATSTSATGDKFTPPKVKKKRK